MRLRTIGLISVLAFGLLAAPLPAKAQQAGKVYRIGFLDFRLRSTTTDPRFVAFRQGLRELGYVEGQNLVIEYRSARGKRDRPPELAAELVKLKVDILVTSGSNRMVLAAQRATRTIPIVMASLSLDPVEAGFVTSLARPGGNITGSTSVASKIHPKRLEILKEASPRIARVAIIWTPRQQKQAMTEVEAAGPAMGLQIQSVLVDPGLGLASLESAFSTINQERPDALLVGSSALTLRNRARVVDFTAKRRLPTIYDSKLFVNAGGLMSYGPKSTDNYRRAATYVDKILRGAKPAELPIELPTKFELVINIKTAKALDLTIPPSILYRADKVIK